MLVFPPERELQILVCLLLLPALPAGAGLPHKLGQFEDTYRTKIHDTTENGTNLIESGTPMGLNAFRARRSILLRVKPVNCTKSARDGVISANTGDQAVPRGVNFLKVNSRNLTRTNEIWNGYLEFNLFEVNGSKAETVKVNITLTVLPDVVGTNETGQMYANEVKDTEKELELNSGAKSRKGNTLNGKSRRSVVDQVNGTAMFPMTKVADDGNMLLEAKPATVAVEASDEETLAGTTTEPVYEVGNGGDEADYYGDGDDYVGDYHGDNNRDDGNDLVEDDSRGDRDIIDVGNSGDQDNIIDVINSSDCVTIEGDNSGDCDNIESDNSGDCDTIEGDNSGDCDTIGSDNSGDRDLSGDNGDNDGCDDGLDEGSGDYSGSDKDGHYDINDYDYDKDEVENAGDDSTGLGIGDFEGDFDSLEKIYPPHFVKMLLEKYHKTQQMMMTINISETKDIRESPA